MNLVLVSLLSLMALTAPSAQEPPRTVTLAQVLSGAAFPLTLNPRDLSSEFKAIEVHLAAADGAPGLASAANREMPLAVPQDEGQGNLGAEREALRALRALYTRGEVVSLDGSLCYVAYGFDAAETRDPSGSPRLPAWLKLRLVKVDTVASLVPLGEARPLLNPLVMAVQRRREEALRRVRELGLAALRYASDHEDELPYVQSSASALAAIYPYVRLRDALASPTPGGRFIFNMNLGGVDLEDSDPPSDTPLFIEELLDPTAPVAVVYADGNTKLVTPEVFAALNVARERRFARRRNAQPLPLDYMLDTLPVALGGRKGLPPLAKKSSPPVKKSPPPPVKKESQSPAGGEVKG